MSTVTAPDFGALLAPHINSVPETAMPAFLARLERTGRRPLSHVGTGGTGARGGPAGLRRP